MAALPAGADTMARALLLPPLKLTSSYRNAGTLFLRYDLLSQLLEVAGLTCAPGHTCPLSIYGFNADGVHVEWENVAARDLTRPAHCLLRRSKVMFTATRAPLGARFLFYVDGAGRLSVGVMVAVPPQVDALLSMSPAQQAANADARRAAFAAMRALAPLAP